MFISSFTHSFFHSLYCLIEEGGEVWSDSDNADECEVTESPPGSQQDTSPASASPIDASSRSLVKWLLVFFLMLQAHFHLADRVVNFIFIFLKRFFIVLGHLYGPCAVLGVELPATLYKAKRAYKNSHDHNVCFCKFPVCKRCGTVWKYDDCFDGHGIYQKAKLCSYVSPFSRDRQKCGGVLLKTVELATNRKIFYPLMTYCYIDLRTSLQTLLLDPDFSKNCTHWKSLVSSGSDLHDVYDGRIWKRFRHYNGTNFLDDDFSYALMINMDWFQPYKHLTYSVGAIYLSIFNLPRTSRYKLHNICLIGIIPGPREPELTVNPYLNPLVQDLLDLWDGIELEVCSGSHIERKLVRGALICCSCDLPAGRKLCGFLSHSAHFGCSKCKKYFPSAERGLDYSGFERESWIDRTNQSHREDVAKLRECTSKSALRKMEKELGCRYTSLLDLPYFDAPTMLVIDPMHCLFLGLAKRFFIKGFIGADILSKADLSTIQRRIDAVSVPSDIGRIPYKIEHAFYSFTADQYKNWVLHYSIICLHGLLSTEYLECWRHLVLACRYLCQHILKPNDVIIADALLLRFCTRTERLFGREFITPNMHMSCHLRECILDYGPLNHFWLFAFERFNGILGQLPNNNRSIETQMMKRFLADTEVLHMQLPTEFKDDFQELVTFHRNPVGTVGTDMVQPIDGSGESNTDLQIPHNSIRCVFNSSEIDKLTQFFAGVYSASTAFEISATYSKYSIIGMGGKVYGSYKSRSQTSSVILAENNGETRPARINYFARVSTLVEETYYSHIVLCLSWFKGHAQKNLCGKPVTIWEHDLFDMCNFLPVQQILCRTVTLVDKLDDVYGNVLFVSPYD